MDGNKILTVKDIAIMAVLTSILFVQEQLLSSLPGIQLTVFLLVLYSKKFGLVKSSIIIVIHVILDNLFMNSFSLMYTPTMLIGWLIIPLTLCTIFKKVESPIWLALLGVMYSFIYSWLYIIPNYFIMHIDPIAYIISDIIFEVVLAGISFITILCLYNPMSKVINIITNNNKN
jgi:hypothetical protein